MTATDFIAQSTLFDIAIAHFGSKARDFANDNHRTQTLSHGCGEGRGGFIPLASAPDHFFSPFHEAHNGE